MNSLACLLSMVLCVADPNEAESLSLENPHNETIKVWIWDFGRQDWVYSTPIVLRPKTKMDPILKPGKYQLVFKNKDNVAIRRDADVRIVGGKKGFEKAFVSFVVVVRVPVPTFGPKTHSGIRLVVNKTYVCPNKPD